MKHLALIIFGIILFGSFSGCGSRNKSKILENYKYEAEGNKLNDELQKKVGEWIKDGMTCYGIVILNDENGLPLKLVELKAKVVAIQSDRIKMKSLEDLALAPVAGCSKIGMKKGETWDEKEGDLFQKREEAIQFIDTNYPGMRIKKVSGR